ncbi:proline-rich transmembrane protein 3 [Bombina bombina]|uniref:proline-rich transmembrane protein 3 n=1 Tax=Bombina bombina TaxID=8345 RepID=UPI00235AD4EF|nr:proline-rich transmembrane protein 3 [Bombina bombina]XP_053576912.1 proline-rich transmembrane protein 3 [Bombina bombina]
MAEIAVLTMWLFLAPFVVMELSVSLADNSIQLKPVHGFLEERLMKSQSEDTSNYTALVHDIESSKISHLKENGNVEEILTHTQPGVNSFGNAPSPTVFINLEKIEDYPKEQKEMASDGIFKSDSKELADLKMYDNIGTKNATTLNPLLKMSSSISEVFDKNSSLAIQHFKGTQLYPSRELLTSQDKAESAQIKNYIEPEKEESKMILSTAQPTVSTILFATSPQKDRPITQIQKLQIASGNEQASKELTENTLGFHHDVELGTHGTLRQTEENNFLDDNFIPKMNAMQSSEMYQAAAYRTTESYSVLQDTGPVNNEVLTEGADELHLTEDHLQYQKDSDSLESAENETVDLQPKQRAGFADQRVDLELSSKNHPKLSTMVPFLDKLNLSHGTKHVTLESKASVQTERIPAATHEVKKEEKDNNELSTNKMHPHEKLMSSMPPHETPTPAMQVLGKDPDKLKEPLQSSAQPGSALVAPAMTQRSPDTGSAPPGLVMSTTWNILATRQTGAADNDRPSSGFNPLQKGDQANSNTTKRTGRRGEIRVTTQRAFQKPHLLEAPTSFPSRKSNMETPICTKTGGTCEFLGSNMTLLKWDHLHNTLSFAWDMHVYGTGVLFVLLSVIAMVNLIGSPILQVPYLPYILMSNSLLFAVGVLRAVLFFLDPYGTKSIISYRVSLVLYNVTFPLILTTFATLVLLVLNIGCLQLLPPKIQSLPLLAVVGVIHFIILLSADLLTHFLNPSVNIVLQILSISWGIFLMVGTFVVYYRLRKCSKDIVNETQRVSPTTEDIVSMQTQGRNIKCLFTSSRVLLVSSVFGLLCCGLQVYALLWLYGLLGKKNEFSWSWWFVQFWFRIFELALCFSMMFIASHSFCLQCSTSDHTCWSKIISYFCVYNKTEIPEYPNNCYDWTNNIQDRVINNNISKSIIRNQAENVPLRILKETNENKPNVALNSRSASPLARPKPEHIFGPKSQNVTMGRSYTSICFERESMLSLADLEFRPPSPINLSRSIDEALFREHLVRDSIFLDSSLQYPSYITRQDSCSSLKECSALNQTVDPLISSDLKMRRCSNPDYMYSLARHSSQTEVDSTSESLPQSKDLPRDVTTEAEASVSSLDSVSKGSIKISWNPWRHGRLSSVESLPMEDTPNTQLLKQGSQPSIPSKGSEPEKIFGRRLIERSQTTDSHSIASDTIEL